MCNDNTDFLLRLYEYKKPSENNTGTDQEVNHESFYNIICEGYDKNEVLLKPARMEENITRYELNSGLDWIHLTGGGKREEYNTVNHELLTTKGIK